MADVENRSLGISLGPNTGNTPQGFAIGSSQQRATERAVDRFAGSAENLQSFLQGTSPSIRSFNPPAKSTEPLLSINLQDILKANAGQGIELTNHLYDFELYITNSTRKVFTIPHVSIQNFTIDDRITEIGASGSLTINFDNDRAENLDNFIFENNGEDFLRFRLMPKDLPIAGAGNNSLKLNRKMWELNYIFSIYDIHDVTPKTKSNTDASAYTKLRRFFFRDVRRQLLDTLNVEYSTALSENAGIAFNPEDLSDKNRSISTGLCINEIIKQSFNYDPILSRTGFDTNPSQDWDIGSTDIFVTSGTAETSYELLMDVYKRHVSENVSDFSLFHITRNEGGIGYFTLKPLQKYFAEAGNTHNSPGKLQVEHFFFRNSKKDQVKGRPFRAPILQAGDGRIINDMQKDIKINEHNIIDNYEFVDISPNINANMYTSRCVYSFDFNQRQFNIEFDKHSINTSSETINKSYISNLYKRSGNNSLINNSSTIKQINRNVIPQYSLYGDSNNPDKRLPDGFQKLLKTGILQNTCINFTVPGLTIRQTGTFIGIDRLYGSDNNVHDNKICGQWFVIDVKHILAAGMYYNTITAIKIHSYS